MTAADPWELVARYRRALADTLADLPARAWDAASLCARRRVRDVAAHLAGNAEGAFTVRRALPGLIRHRFDVDAFLYHDARARAAAEPAALVARLRSAAGNRHLPPGRKPADVLADALIHTQDALRPLGIGQHAHPEALLIALEASIPQGPPLRTKQRAAGLRLRATDLDWAWGDGAEVSGPAEALLLATTGRATALTELSGPGVSILAQRCPPPMSTERPLTP